MTPEPSATWRGKTVLVLGGGIDDDSGPNESGLPVDEFDIRIEEAALALARAVLARGGRLMFLDAPVFTPLFLEVALEYWEALPAEEGLRAVERRFVEAPLAIVGTETSHAESWEWARRIGMADAIQGATLEELQPNLIVLIGGNEGAREETSRLRRAVQNRVRVVALPSTGGAARAATLDGNIIDAETVVTLARERTYFEPPAEFADGATGRTVAEPEPIPEMYYAIYPIALAAVLDSNEAIAL